MAHVANSSFPNSQIVHTQQDSPASQMPPDVTVEILKHVKSQDVGTCQLVCKQWHQLFSDNSVWRTLLENHFPFYTIPKDMQDFGNGYKDLYCYEFNLLNEIFASHELEGHEYRIRVLANSREKLFSNAQSNKIKIWDLNTQTYLGELEDPMRMTPDRIVYNVCNGQLISSSRDDTIRIWDLNKKTCLQIPTGHTGQINSIEIENGRLYSNSADGTIKIWDLNTNACLETLTTHHKSRSIQVSNGKLYSSAFMGEEIKVWDLKTKTGLATLTGNKYTFACFKVFNETLYSGSYTGEIEIWDLRTSTCLTTFKGHDREISSLDVFNGKLISSSWDEKIKIWDLNTNACLATLDAPTGTLNLFDADNGKFIYCHPQGKITVQNFKADLMTVFKELADEFGTVSIERTMSRFSRMPKSARNKIYGELYKILKPLNLIQEDYLGCAEHAFHDIHGQSSTPAQKAQAIRNFLESQRKPADKEG